MSDIYDRQKIQNDLQKNDEILDTFSKIVSGGKSGYKTIIEKKPLIMKCISCGTVIDANQKFCHECGAKVEKAVSSQFFSKHL